MAAAWVFVADLDDPVLEEADDSHLRRSRRLPPGAPVVASDGAGRWRACRLGADGGLEPVGDAQAIERPSPAVTVAVALTKGERPELAVQKLTELGVDRVVPFVAARSVARWEGERAERHLERLRRVAREAAMQSRRTHLPEVAEVDDFAGVAALTGAVRAEPGGAPPSLALPTVLVGPEGGWSEEERAADLPTVGLGPTVLRAETAAIAAGWALTALRAGVVDEASRFGHAT